MGGIGSGNRCQYGRTTVGQCLRLDVCAMKRYGLFDAPSRYKWTWGKDRNASNIQVDTTNPNYVHLTYESRGDQYNYSVHVAKVAQHLGGIRRWFVCPNMRCGRRCKTLYLKGNYFLCRECQNLGYSSEQASKQDQAFIQIEKIRQRLGWPAGYLNGWAGKPKWMRWKTYYALVDKHQQYANMLDSTLLGFISKCR